MNSPALPQDTSPPSDLERVIRILRRRAWVIGLCVIVAGGAAFLISKAQTKEYTATASLVFNSGQISQQVAGLQPVNPTETTSQQNTRVKLLQIGQTAEQTANKLGEGMTAQDVGDSIAIEPEGESAVVDVHATSTSPEMAATIANAYANQFVIDQVGKTHKYFVSAKNLVEKELSALSPQERASEQGLALQSRAQSLAILAKLKSEEVQVARVAKVPSGASSPKVTRNTVIGAALGLIFGLALAFVLERLNRKLRDPEEARDLLGLPVLGTVPESKSIMASNQGSVAPDLPFMENEAFRTLRASLRYFNVDHDMRSVLITANEASAGKSTVSWNLARVAGSSSKAIIVETDLRNPTLASQHGLKGGPGLAQLLTHQITLEEAIQHKGIATPANGNGGAARGFDVIVAGSVPPNPAELIESQAMADVLTQLTDRYELVVIDTPPVGVVADAFPLLRKADGVIIIARMGETSRDAAQRLREQLRRLEAPVLGFVANGVKVGRRDKYGYGYGYYGGRPDGEDPQAQQADAADPQSSAAR